MKKIALILSLSALSLLMQNVEAATMDPASLVKVSGNNNPKCVEYYIYKGETYCNTTSQSTAHPDPKIKNYEKLKLIFDDRAWFASWGEKNDKITTVEYLPSGGDIKNWYELVTTQFIPGIQDNVTPKQFADLTIAELKKINSIKYTTNFIDTTPDTVIFEFKVTAPDNLKQHELQKITKGSDGMYVEHYAIKVPDMDKANRDKWLNILRSTKIK